MTRGAWSHELKTLGVSGLGTTAGPLHQPSPLQLALVRLLSSVLTLNDLIV